MIVPTNRPYAGVVGGPTFRTFNLVGTPLIYDPTSLHWALMCLSSSRASKESLAYLTSAIYRIDDAYCRWFVTSTNGSLHLSSYLQSDGLGDQYKETVSVLDKFSVELESKRLAFPRALAFLGILRSIATIPDAVREHTHYCALIRSLEGPIHEEYLSRLTSLTRTLELAAESEDGADFVEHLEELEVSLWPGHLKFEAQFEQSLFELLRRAYELTIHMVQVARQRISKREDDLRSNLALRDWSRLHQVRFTEAPDRGALAGLCRLLDYTVSGASIFEWNTERMISQAITFLKLTRAYDPLPLTVNRHSRNILADDASEGLQTLRYMFRNHHLSKLAPELLRGDPAAVVLAITRVLGETSFAGVEQPTNKVNVNAPGWVEACRLLDDSIPLKLCVDVWFPVYFAGLITCGSEDHRAKELLKDASAGLVRFLKELPSLSNTVCHRIEETVQQISPRHNLTLGHACHILCSVPEIFVGNAYDLTKAVNRLKHLREGEKHNSGILSSSGLNRLCSAVASRVEKDLGTSFVREFYQSVGLMLTSENDSLTNVLTEPPLYRVPKDMATGWRNEGWDKDYDRLCRSSWEKVSREISTEARALLKKLRDHSRSGQTFRQSFDCENFRLLMIGGERNADSIQHVLVARRVLLRFAVIEKYSAKNPGRFVQHLGFVKRGESVIIAGKTCPAPDMGRFEQMLNYFGLRKAYLYEPSADGCFDEELEWLDSFIHRKQPE